MDHQAKSQPSTEKPQAPDSSANRQSKDKTLDVSIQVSEQSREGKVEGGNADDSKVNTSGNYFKSIVSDRDFSKFDFDDHKWIRNSKSANRESSEESFDNDSVLPVKLATRLATFMENDANRKSLQPSEDEMMGDSPEKKILEQGKEMVRQSGLGVDFSGKLISKEMIQGSIDKFISQTKFSTSLDLGVSNENKFWLEQQPERDQLKPVKSVTFPKKRPRFSKNSIKSSTGNNSENDIQGITSTKYSDLYCQDHLQSLKEKGLMLSPLYPCSQSEVKSQVTTLTKNSFKNEDFGGSSSLEPAREDQSTYHKRTRESLSKSGGSDLIDRTELKNIIAFESRGSSKVRMDSLEKSDLDIFENGSFLNMDGNDSEVAITGEQEKTFQMESFESSNFLKSKKTVEKGPVEPSRGKGNSFVKTQSLDLKSPDLIAQGNPKTEIKSEEKLISLEFPATLPFEAGLEYETMVSRMLDPRQSELLDQEIFLKRSLKQSSLSHSDQKKKLLGEDLNQEDYYQHSSGTEVNPESEYGHLNSMDIREYLTPYARDADHLCQMLIEQKMGRFDIMDKISEEQSMDLDNSFITHGVNKSMMFSKEAKLLHSDSLWLGTKNGRHLLNTSLGSKMEMPRNLLNTSNHMSRELNSSFRLLASQGELASSRYEDADLSGFLLRKSSYKYKKFPVQRKISLKVDGKKFQESQIFFIPESKNNQSRQGLHSPDKLRTEARLKAIRNSDVTAKRNQGLEHRQHSRSLNSSGIHSMNKKNLIGGDEFMFKEYSQSKENHQLMTTKPFKNKGVQGKLVATPLKSNRASIDKSQTRPAEQGKQEVDLQILEKRHSLAFSDAADFDFSYVELNESRNNHTETESMRNIIDHSRVMKGFTADSVITYTNDSALNNNSQFQLKVECDPASQFKKIKISGNRIETPFLGGSNAERSQQEFLVTTESWMNSYPDNMKILSEAMKIPRKISDIPVIDSTKRGSLIMFGGEMTPAHKRSEVIESGEMIKKESLMKHRETPQMIKKEEGKSPESKQNITDLMKMIIQKTENLSTVEESNGVVNETSMNSLENKKYDLIGERNTEEIQITDLEKEEDKPDLTPFSEESNEEPFESSMTNMPSIVNIESTANMPTIFDVNFDRSDLNAKIHHTFSMMHKSNEGRRRDQDPLRGSMLTDEHVSEKGEVFKVVSNTDNDGDSFDQADSILLMTNKEINKRRSTGEWVEVSRKTSGSELDSHVALQSVISNLDDDPVEAWGVNPQASSSLIESSKINFFKKPPGPVGPKEKVPEVTGPGASSLKQKFRHSKLAVKIARMSRKAGRTEAFNMRSPSGQSITNHTDLSDNRHCSPKSQLKQSLKTSKQKGLKEKLWESLVSSKKGYSVDTNSRFDQTLGSASIQSLSKKAKDHSLNTLRKKNKAKKGNRTVRRSNDEGSLKYNKSRYLSGYLKQAQTGEVNQLRDKTGSKVLGEISSTSRFMKNSQHGSNSIYSKVSHKDLAASKKELRRSNTQKNQNQDQVTLDFTSVKFDKEDSMTQLISHDKSQREINADILRKRNKKEIESKFQNIYKPKTSKIGSEKRIRTRVSDRSASEDRRSVFTKEKGGSRKQSRKLQRPQQQLGNSGGVDSQGKDSDTSSFCYGNKNSLNDSNFLPFPRSIKNRENRLNQSKQSGLMDKDKIGIKDYFSGNNMQLNLGQREEYGILSESKLENSSSNTHTKWSSNKSDNNLEKDVSSLQNFGHGQIDSRAIGLNQSYLHKNTFSHSTIKSFKSKQSLKQKIKGSMKMIKENEFSKTEKLYEKKIPLSTVPYSLSLMKNLINNDIKGKGKPGKGYKASSTFKMSRGKSSEFRNSKNEMIWKGSEAGEKVARQSKLGPKGKLDKKSGHRLPPAKETFKKKAIRYSLKESKAHFRKSKNIRERLMKQLMPTKNTSQFSFPQKNYYSNIQSEILGKTADSVILGKQSKNSKPSKIKENSKKFKIKGKFKDPKQDVPKLHKKPSKKKSKPLPYPISKKSKKPINPKQKFLEFQKRKIEKEIRSFHSLEPSSISNTLNRPKDQSVQSNIKNDVIGSLSNIGPAFSPNNGHIYNIKEVKIDKIVSTPQVFNYYYMSPNYNLKLANLDPNATIEIPKDFNEDSQQEDMETIVHNLISPSQNVIKLSENEHVLKFKSTRGKSKAKRLKKLQGTLNVRSFKQKRSVKKGKKFLMSQSEKTGKGKVAKKFDLKIVTQAGMKEGSFLKNKPLTPSFFQQKQIDSLNPMTLLSRETSCLNNANVHSQKITFGALPYPQEKPYTDTESSMSIPMNKSSVIFQENPESEFASHNLISESPMMQKKFQTAKNTLYSSLAFSMSSSLDTSSKFLKIIGQDKVKKKKSSKMKSFMRKEPLNKSSNQIKDKRKQIRILKSQRKLQIQKLKEKNGAKQIKDQYKRVKKKSQRVVKKPSRAKYASRLSFSKGVNPKHFSVRASKGNILNISSKKSRLTDIIDANDEFERRIISSMRQTTGTVGLSKAEAEMKAQLLSVQTSKIHSKIFENLFRDGSQKPSKTPQKKAMKSPHLGMFKQRMSSNMELGKKRLLFDDRGINQSMNSSVIRKDFHGIPKEYGELKEKPFHPRGKKYSWRNQSTSTLRKNTSLDLVLKKKSLKFMDMQKEILKNISKNVQNIYHLNSPNGLEDSERRTAERTVKPRPKKRDSKAKKNVKSGRKMSGKPPQDRRIDMNKRVIGSLDFDEMEDRERSLPKTFESSMKMFRGKREEWTDLTADNLKKMKKTKNPAFKGVNLPPRKPGLPSKKNFGLFKVANKKGPTRLRQDSKLKQVGRNSRKGFSKIKHYCSSQAHNAIPDDLAKKIRDKFNKSTFCKPGQIIKKKMDASKFNMGGAGAKDHMKTQTSSNMPMVDLISNVMSLRNLNDQEHRKSKIRGGTSGVHIPNPFNTSDRSSNVFSGPVSYSSSKKNILITDKLSKSIKAIPKIKMDSVNDPSYQRENYFSITSEEKNKHFTLIQSVLSLGTESSLYSNPNKDNEEFNLYCVDQGQHTNHSGSQLDIIYNKNKRKKKRKVVKTAESRQSQVKGDNKMLFPGGPKNTLSFKRIVSKSKKQRWKKHSFQNKVDN